MKNQYIIVLYNKYNQHLNKVTTSVFNKKQTHHLKYIEEQFRHAFFFLFLCFLDTSLVKHTLLIKNAAFEVVPLRRKFEKKINPLALAVTGLSLAQAQQMAYTHSYYDLVFSSS